MERRKSRKITGSLKGIIIIRVVRGCIFFWNNDRRPDQARKADIVERENYGSRRKPG